MVDQIIQIFSRHQTNTLAFTLITRDLSQNPSSIAGVLSSYPSHFTKLKDGIWQLVPEGLLTGENIKDIYGVSDETLESLYDGSDMRYKWIRITADNKGRYNRRDVHYLLWHWRKDAKDLKDSAVEYPARAGPARR
jgi:hypothetical protein